MKNLILYYIGMLVPAIFLAVAWKLLISEVALSLMLFYVLVYRTWLDGSRLHKKGLIARKDIWKTIYNGDRANYFKELYLRK